LHIERRRGVVVELAQEVCVDGRGEAETVPRSLSLLPPQAATRIASPKRIGSARLTAG
jgi:hypothetical protein